jgi:hypothetical protein
LTNPKGRYGGDGNPAAPVADWIICPPPGTAGWIGDTGWIAELPNPERGWGSGPPKPDSENMGLNGISEVSGFCSGLPVTVDFSLFLEASVFS